MQLAQEDRIERLDIALDKYWIKGGKLNGVEIMSIPAIKQIANEAQLNPVRLDAASLTNRLTQMMGAGTQQSVSQMYYADPMLANYKKTMDLLYQGINQGNVSGASNQNIATYQMYVQYLRQRNIQDPDEKKYQEYFQNANVSLASQSPAEKR